MISPRELALILIDPWFTPKEQFSPVTGWICSERKEHQVLARSRFKRLSIAPFLFLAVVTRRCYSQEHRDFS
jgi:hypothetical protein